MSGKERVVRAESILRRQANGSLSKWDAAAEFDELLMREGDGNLVFYSDSTGLSASWNLDVMLFPRADRSPSNTGIYCRGPLRGVIVTVPEGALPDCMPEVLEHFQKSAAHRPGGNAS